LTQAQKDVFPLYHVSVAQGKIAIQPAKLYSKNSGSNFSNTPALVFDTSTSRTRLMKLVGEALEKREGMPTTPFLP
jgi:hypothetical protein